MKPPKIKPLTHKLVVALGGNAISTGDHRGNIPNQFEQSRITAKHLGDLLDAGHRLIITHGNGPQVGTVLRRVELSRHEVYPIDLGLAVADTQAGMGYMICQCLRNEMRAREKQLDACTLVTTVLVDANDPAFEKPTKPIGMYYDRQTIEERIASDGWQVVEVPKKGWRRVVPSPKPKRIQEIDLIARLFDEGHVIVCCGGGGIPVVYTSDTRVDGVEAVIDKDLTAAKLGIDTQADTLAIVTDVERVALNFGQPNEQPVAALTVQQAQEHLAAGQFPAGSMGPKIEACINFVSLSTTPGSQAIITNIAGLSAALRGETGTRVVRE
ncbi:MAG: carbamate kinase [Phycisphaerales bacterium]|nr:carbamate kinase [Phycisphaerales bacterium]